MCWVKRFCFFVFKSCFHVFDRRQFHFTAKSFVDNLRLASVNLFLTCPERIENLQQRCLRRLWRRGRVRRNAPFEGRSVSHHIPSPAATALALRSAVSFSPRCRRLLRQWIKQNGTEQNCARLALNKQSCRQPNLHRDTDHFFYALFTSMRRGRTLHTRAPHLHVSPVHRILISCVHSLCYRDTAQPKAWSPRRGFEIEWLDK